jgi:hypothetical protein
MTAGREFRDDWIGFGVSSNKKIALHNLCTIFCRTPRNTGVSPELQARRTRESEDLH